MGVTARRSHPGSRGKRGGSGRESGRSDQSQEQVPSCPPVSSLVGVGRVYGSPEDGWGVWEPEAASCLTPLAAASWGPESSSCSTVASCPCTVPAEAFDFALSAKLGAHHRCLEKHCGLGAAFWG